MYKYCKVTMHEMVQNKLFTIELLVFSAQDITDIILLHNLVHFFKFKL